MGKRIVVYDSIGGNTERVAARIAAGLECEAVHIDDFKAASMSGIDLVVLGSPIIEAKATKKVKGMVRALGAARACALFCTFGAPGWGHFGSWLSMYFLKNKLDCPCLGTFSCTAFHHKLKTYAGHPTAADLDRAERFGRSLRERMNSF